MADSYVTEGAHAAPQAPQNGRPLPGSIVPATNLSPNEMRALKAQTGRTLTDLLGGDAEDMDRAPDRIQAMVWVALRRAGHHVPYEAAGDVVPIMDGVVATPDPTSTAV